MSQRGLTDPGIEPGQRGLMDDLYCMKNGHEGDIRMFKVLDP